MALALQTLSTYWGSRARNSIFGSVWWFCLWLQTPFVSTFDWIDTQSALLSLDCVQRAAWNLYTDEKSNLAAYKEGRVLCWWTWFAQTQTTPAERVFTAQPERFDLLTVQLHLYLSHQLPIVDTPRQHENSPKKRGFQQDWRPNAILLCPDLCPSKWPCILESRRIDLRCLRRSNIFRKSTKSQPRTRA